MNRQQPTDFVDLKRQLDHATQAIEEYGVGNLANLECRVSDLRDRLIAMPAQTLDDIEVRLAVIRDLVSGLGPRGYLMHLVEATLRDVKAMRMNKDAT